MSNHINLMTSRSRVREYTRTRGRQWSGILVVVIVLLVVHSVFHWWPLHVGGQKRAAMEAQYAPVRQMKTTNRALSKQIADTLDQSKLELALSKQTPVLTLLGLLSQVVAASEGKLFLEQIAYTQDTESPQAENAPAQIDLEGFSSDTESVKQFAESLRTSLPFADVTLRPIRTIELNQKPVQTFQIECSF